MLNKPTETKRYLTSWNKYLKKRIMIFRKLALKEKIFYETTLIYTHIEATYIYKVYTYIYIYSTILYNIKMYKLLV